MRAFVLFLCLAAAWPASTAAAPAAAAPPGVRLYALDCGRIAFQDMAMFDDSDASRGRPGSMVAPCFLVVHPRGTLLWDTGLGDAIAASPGGVDFAPGIHLSVKTTLRAQLGRLGLQPGDIDFVALSHLHVDHAGNLAEFPRSTWIIDRTELAWARRDPPPVGVVPAQFAGAAQAALRDEDGDIDLFGDGTVRILRTPGHTPGHRVLMLQLRHAGTVILSGDLWHSRANYEHDRVPPINDSRADTMASFDRVRQLMATHHARLVIQHDPGDFAGLPAFPAFLD